jgi:hypothetical protein
MKQTRTKPNADTLAVWKALKHAAKNARKLAREMGTPFYVVQNGWIVDLNGVDKRKRKVS